MNFYEEKKGKTDEEIEDLLVFLLLLAKEEFAKPGCVYTNSSGKTSWINPTSWLESKIRTQIQDEYNDFVLSYLTKELKNDLVITNSLPDCSIACSVDQGLVRSANGLTKGVKTIADSIKTGLFHFSSLDGRSSTDPSCRHTVRLFIKGLTPIPEKYKLSEMKINRKVSERKRYVERQIRKYKAVGNKEKVLAWSKQAHDKNRIW